MATDPALSPAIQALPARGFAPYSLLRAQLNAVAWPTVIVGVITLAALAQRMYLALGDSLPLGDGGMFYAVIEQIKAGGYSFPETVVYDEVEIPFAYSPLTFYFAALISDVFGIDSLEVLRFLPVVVSCLTIPAFYLLAKAVLNRTDGALVATGVFASHASFVWLIMGGGLTRSFGFFLAILTIYHLYRLTKDDASRRRMLIASACAAATVLTHLEMAWLVGLFYFLTLCHFTKSWRDLVYPAFVAAIALVLIAPWLVIVLSHHGVEPYVNALQAGARQPKMLMILLALPLTRFWFVPSLYLASTFFGGRNLQFPWGLSLALLAGSLSGWLIKMVQARKETAAAHVRVLRAVGSAGAAIGVLTLVAHTVVSTNWAIEAWTARPPGEAASFGWVKASTPSDSRFVVVADTDTWGFDHTGEWLPALTGRLTLTTVQGREWLKGQEGYVAADDAYGLLRQCVTETVDCLEAWQPVQNVDYTHVYITKDACCSGLRESLARAAGYRLAYDGPGAQIYERLEPLPGN